MSGKHTKGSKRWWTFYYPIFCVTHDTLFIGQDHRVLRETKLGSERLSAWDQDIIRWRKFAVENARGYNHGRPAESNGNGASAQPAAAPSALDEAGVAVAAPEGAVPTGAGI